MTWNWNAFVIALIGMAALMAVVWGCVSLGIWVQERWGTQGAMLVVLGGIALTVAIIAAIAVPHT